MTGFHRSSALTARFDTDDALCIIGCGYSGSVVAQRLAFDGRPVIGTARREAQANVIRTRGAEPVMVTLPKLEGLKRHAAHIAGVVTMVPPQMLERSDAFEDWTGKLLEYFGKHSKLKAFVYVSSTSVYGDQAGATVTEHSECQPDSPRGKARLAIEKQVLQSGLPSMIVRPSGIYGPGRSQAHRLAAGKYRIVGEGDALTNRIHVRDLASIVIGALDRGTPGDVYLASDVEPAPQAAVADFCVDQFKLPAPHRISVAEAKVRMTPNVFRMITGSKRLDASWTRDRLGVTLRFPTYREGLAAVWHQEGDSIRALAS